MLLVILLYALLALTFTLAKAAVTYADPLFLLAVRMITAGSILLTFYVLKLLWHKTPFNIRVTRHDILDFTQVTLFHIYLSFTPEFWALQFLSSVKVNIMYATTPFIVMFLSYIVYKHTVTASQIMGTCVAFASLMPLLLKTDYPVPVHYHLGLSLPECALLLSIISAAYAWFIIKRLMDRGFSLLSINGFAMLVGGLMTLATWQCLRMPASAPIYNVKYFIFSVAALIVLSNIVVYNLYGWLLRYYSFNFLACAGFLSPLFGALYGRVLLGEALGWQHVCAIIGITIGLYLFFHDELSLRRSTPAPLYHE